MKIQICSYREALKFSPLVPTYAIRIFSTNQKPIGLINSPNWVHIAAYTFDEESLEEYLSFSEEEKKAIPVTLFTETTAKNILEDFIKFKDCCESMLVHCVTGVNRSKAIGKAMNDILDLGNPNDIFLNKYKELNCRHFYDTMIRQAQKMGM